MQIHEFIQSCVEAHEYVTWGEACKTFLGKVFRPSDIPTLVKTFRDAVPGSDALLVNSRGAFSEKAPVEEHLRWLKERGYAVLPSVERNILKPAKVSVQDLEKQIAELKSMLVAQAQVKAA